METNENQSIVIAIDGPAGAGKSSVAKRLAEVLGFDFLDTGAMYRCVTLAVLKANVSTSDSRAVSSLARDLTVSLNKGAVSLNGEDVSEAIRAPEIGASIGCIADNIEVRRELSLLQRRWAAGKCVVTEGRDQGTEVFSDSPCKIFLVASNKERAKRRLRELQQKGIDADLATVLQQQDKRDLEDQSRVVGGLRKAEDAIEFSTDGLSLNDVVKQLCKVILSRLSENEAIAARQKATQLAQRLGTIPEFADAAAGLGNTDVEKRNEVG